jgi:two-component system chemotaxis response regulator CheB
MNAMPRVQAIVIGGSSGALEALGAILPALPAGFPIPVAVVLHVPEGKSYVAQVLRTRSVLVVKEAEDKEPLAPATVYLAPPSYHLLIERNRCFALSADDPVNFSRPAIDVLFDSAADSYGPNLAGLILTGASDDGARGLAHVKEAGGTALVQSPGTAAMPLMPEAAIRLAQVDRILPLAELGPHLAGLARWTTTREDG